MFRQLHNSRQSCLQEQCRSKFMLSQSEASARDRVVVQNPSLTFRVGISKHESTRKLIWDCSWIQAVRRIDVCVPPSNLNSSGRKDGQGSRKNSRLKSEQFLRMNSERLQINMPAQEFLSNQVDAERHTRMAASSDRTADLKPRPVSIIKVLVLSYCEFVKWTS